MIIMGAYAWPALQTLGVLLLNTFYLGFLLKYQMYDSRVSYIRDIFNECLILLTNYILLCFTNYYIIDAVNRNNLGEMLISITVINFVINLIAILIHAKLVCKKR